jgi:hypothetical protein
VDLVAARHLQPSLRRRRLACVHAAIVSRPHPPRAVPMAAGVAGRPDPWPARHTLGTTLRDKQGRLKLPPKGASRRPQQGAAAPLNQSREAHHPAAAPHHSPRRLVQRPTAELGDLNASSVGCGDRSISKVTPRWALPSILSRTDDARLRQGWVLALLCNRRSEATPRPWDRKEAAHTRIVWTQEEKRPKTSSQTGSTPVGWTCKMR